MKKFVFFLFFFFSLNSCAVGGEMILDYYPNQMFFAISDSQNVPKIGLKKVTVIRVGSNSFISVLTTEKWKRGDTVCVRTFEFTDNSHYLGSSMPFAVRCH